MTDPGPEKLSDIDLMQRVKRGDAAAFTVLFERHHRRVLNIVHKYLGNESEADDLAQEVFLRIHRAAPRYEARAAFTTWLYQITTNLCLNFRRNRARRGRVLSMGTGQSEDTATYDPVAGAEDPHGTAPSDRISDDETAVAVRAAIQELPERQRMAMLLMHYENLSHEDIGAAMGISANAAKQMCHRARETLREKLTVRLKKQE